MEEKILGSNSKAEVDKQIKCLKIVLFSLKEYSAPKLENTVFFVDGRRP
jgi:hypothetical protein